MCASVYLVGSLRRIPSQLSVYQFCLSGFYSVLVFGVLFVLSRFFLLCCWLVKGEGVSLFDSKVA